ncbi:MAG TPA: hypothetical protein HA224_03820 [Nanoarchaeota archaeon]|nr:hypothetical protein [Nanoarchaeota archaeon]
MGNISPISQHSESYWSIPNVWYRGKWLTVELRDSLLPEMTQAQAGAYIRANPDGFVTRELPMYFAIFRSLEQQRTQPDVSAPLAFIRKSIRIDWLQTLTAIDYLPKDEKDVVTHGIGTEKPHQKKVDVVGPNRQITQEDSACLEALVGTGNVGTVNRVLTFINSAPVYLWRLNSKPFEVYGCVARLYADADGSYLDCKENPQLALSSLGVREGVLEERVAKPKKTA